MEVIARMQNSYLMIENSTIGGGAKYSI